VKLRSLSELEQAVDRETAWRKRELTNILFLAREARSSKAPTALRAGVALLYAHWEGWIKNIATFYIEYVAQQRLTYEQLSTPFFAVALKRKITELGEAATVASHIDFAVFLRNDLSGAARLSTQGAVITEANLSSSLLRDIVRRLGLDYRPYELQANLIDRGLLYRRNNIAHGEYLEVDIAEFELLHSEITDLLRRFAREALNHAATRSYRV
jgi:hypothetical protein